MAIDRFRRPAFSLKKIWTALILFAVVIPITITIFWFGIDSYNNKLEKALLVERHANELLRDKIESEFKRLKTLLQNKSEPLSLLLGKHGSIKDVNALLKNISDREYAVREIIIASKQSEIIAAVVPGVGITGDRLLSSKELQDVALHWGYINDYKSPEIVIPSLDRIYIGSPKKHEGFIGFTISLPIGNPAKAILSARIDVDRLWPKKSNKYYKSEMEKENTLEYMLDRRGSLITKVEQSDFNPGVFMTHLAITRAALMNENWPVDLPYIGVVNQSVFGTKTDIPSLHWTLITEVQESQIMQPIWDSILKIIILALLGMILFILFVLYLANKTIEPIQSTCEAINNFAKDELQSELKSCGIYELDTMTSGFNDMVKERQTAINLLYERERNLIESRKRYQSLFDMSADAFLIIEDSKFTDCNQATLDMLGYEKKEDILNLSPADLSPKFQLDGQSSELKANAMMQQAISNGSHRFEWQHKRINGIVFPVEVLLTFILFEGRKLFHVVWRDITERKQQEELVNRTEKMEALGKLTGGIAHDYNNMLGVILGYSEILKEKLVEDPKLTNFVEQIHHAADRGANLTTKLLTFTRDKSNHAEKLNINTILEYQKDMLEKILTARIKLNYELDKELWPVWLDSSEFEDVIINMSINAMHAIDGHGQFTIQAYNKSISEKEAKRLQVEAGDYVMLSLIDTGCGMDNIIRNKIFDPFYSTKGDNGTGLGLSQVYGFVQRFKGAIEVYSEPSHGTQFTLYFPREINRALQGKETTTVQEKDFRGKENILIVDDEPSLRKMIFDVLEQQGYRVFSADNGKQALEVMSKENIDLILTDIVMPEMDGYELATIVQEKYPNIKIQLVSGFTDDRHTNSDNSDLHKNLLRKPYSLITVLERIRLLLNSTPSAPVGPDNLVA